jgi:acyl dehydratase
MVNPIRKRAAEGLGQGDSFKFERRFTREDTLLFGDITHDYNPVHYDPRWASLKGFKSAICHGLLVGSMICEFGGQVGWLATGMNFKFIKPVYFGDTVHCTITITKIEANGRAEAEAIFENQQGEQVGYAHLKGRLPLDPERMLLMQMITEGDQSNQLKNEPDARTGAPLRGARGSQR